jgi:hypothetical protein
MKKKPFFFPKIACESPKYALKGSKYTINRCKNYLSCFKSAFCVFWHFPLLNLAFSAHWHLATLNENSDSEQATGRRRGERRKPR